MKTLCKFLVIISLVTTAFTTHLQAERGDLYSYEELAYFTYDDVVSFMQNQFSGYLDPEANPEFFDLATSFFQNLIDQRNIRVYKLIYETVDFYGNPTQASGIVLIPEHDTWTCTRSFSIYDHGTVFRRESVNSRPSNWGGEFMLTLMMASLNTICAAPDYYGLGDGPGFHHHNTYRTNVNSSIDCVRAGRNLCDILGVTYNNRLLPMGYSEGGHASMGIAKMVTEEGLQDEFQIPFVGAGSGAYDMSGEAFNFILGNPYYITPAYILYQLATCEDIYGNLVLEEEGETYSTYLTSPYDQYFEQYILSQSGNIGWVPSYWPSMFHPEKVQELVGNPNHPFRVCLGNSNVYNWRNIYPTLMYYCTTDGQVPYTGALKTRDVQRALLPWYLFWQRFKIQAINLTFGDLIPSHEACALPSIMVQLIFMYHNLGLDCEYTGRQQEVQALRTVGREFIDSRTVYSRQSLDFSPVARGKQISNVLAYNLNTGEQLTMHGESRIDITENGFYLFRITYGDQTVDYSWLMKSDPDYVPTDDYDPVVTNPMIKGTWIDLTLLPEDVRRVTVVDAAGNEIASIEDGLETGQVYLNRPEGMADGDYTVLVKTDRNNYPLELKVRSEIESSGLTTYPNPVSDILKISTEECDQSWEISVYDSQGAEVLRTNAQTSGCSIDLKVKGLPSGVYRLGMQSGKVTRAGSFVVM